MKLEFHWDFSEYLELEEEPAVASVEAEKSEIVTENWTQTETFQLIALYKEHESSQLEDEPRANFWKFIQSELERDGIYVSSFIQNAYLNADHCETSNISRKH